MFKIEPKTNNVVLTKGDTATMFVQIFDLDNKEYEILPTDTITLTIKIPYTNQVVLTKQATHDHYIIINHEDTSDLPVRDYVYDVQLSTQEGFVYTIIPCANFSLTCEVTI